MHADESWGAVAFVPRPLTSEERTDLCRCLAVELPHLRRLLDAAEHAADGPDPEASLVFLGLLTSRASAVLFPR